MACFAVWIPSCADEICCWALAIAWLALEIAWESLSAADCWLFSALAIAVRSWVRLSSSAMIVDASDLSAFWSAVTALWYLLCVAWSVWSWL